MKRKSSIQRRKRKLDDGENEMEEKKCSSSKSHSSSIKKPRSEICILSKKYFNDTVPEETARSTLPSELAEEYLSFVQLCEKRKKVEDNIKPHLDRLEKKPCQLELTNNGSELPAERKENLPVSEEVHEPESAKKGRKRKGRRRKNTVRNLLKCLLCSEEFQTKQKKQEHYNDHLGPRGYECTFCTKAFEKMPALVSHVSRVHLIDKKLFCRICGKKFRREWLLRSHYLTHTSKRKFSCPTCKMGFAHKRHLFEHISGHLGFNPYKCEECGKRFQKSSYLSLHRKIHVSVRPFKCKLCTIQCSSYSAMEIHALMHRENLGFECSDCDVRVPVTMKSHHLISHSRNKNFLCNLCSARFHARSTLQDHLKAHSCTKEYKCDVCEKVLQTIKECSDHVCAKWLESANVELCPVCKSYIKKEFIEKHNAKCHEKPCSTNLNFDPDENEDELLDESGESVIQETNRNVVDGSNCKRDESDSCSTSDLSDTSEIEMDDEYKVDDPLSLDSVSKRYILNLDSGLIQHITQTQNEVEEDETDDEENLSCS